MPVQRVTLRKMTAEEYRSATEHREAESVRVLSRLMTEDVARERVRHGTAMYLPDGLDTADHYLLTAENESGEAVGNAWIGPNPGQAPGAASFAWLYNINVFLPYRRLGFGSAILVAAEALVAREGKSTLGLNVAGDNEAAIALYRRNGYEVTSMAMRKTM